jgi:hypothetical protein
MMKKLLLAAVFALCCVPAAHAQVTSFGGYACNTSYFPVKNATTTGAVVSVNVNSAPDCTGTSIGVATFCTPGAPYSTCSPNTAYDEPALLGLADRLARAVDDNVRIIASLEPCTAFQCSGKYLVFWAN